MSNMAKPWAEDVLDRHGLSDLFDALRVSSEPERPKPHPRGYARAMEGAEGEVAMVSDEFNEDLLMAACLGVAMVRVENEGDERPRYGDPDYTVPDLAEVGPVTDEIAAGESPVDGAGE